MATPPTPAHRQFVHDITARERNEQEPLGSAPTYDEVLDVAVEYTFPASDPVAVQGCCQDIADRAGRASAT
jgi:hypothetical protein